MPLLSDDFIFIEVNGVHGKAVRLVHKETGQNFGEYFQTQCRSMSWRAALTVYEKYKRKYDLHQEDLKSLCDYAVATEASRKEIGKPINKDFLVQICSSELKRRVSVKMDS